MLTVEIKWCPNLIIFDDYILLEASLPLPGASQTFLCRELTGALLEPNICASHSPVSLLHETLNPDNQPKHIQAFILKIPTAKTRGVLTVHKGWNWRLWTCSTNAAGKNNTHLRSGEIQGHSWCDEALWFSSALNNRGNMTSTVPPLAWVVLCARPEWWICYFIISESSVWTFLLVWQIGHWHLADWSGQINFLKMIKCCIKGSDPVSALKRSGDNLDVAPRRWEQLLPASLRRMGLMLKIIFLLSCLIITVLSGELCIYNRNRSHAAWQQILCGCFVVSYRQYIKISTSSS